MKQFPKIVKLYTGFLAALAFEFVVNHVKLKHEKIQYFKGNELVGSKNINKVP